MALIFLAAALLLRTAGASLLENAPQAAIHSSFPLAPEQKSGASPSKTGTVTIAGAPAPCKDVLGPPAEAQAELAPAENKCWVNLLWAKTAGVYERNDWYAPHGLSPSSSYADYQYFLWNKSGNGVGPTYSCRLPCSSRFTEVAAPKTKQGEGQHMIGTTVIRGGQRVPCRDIDRPPTAQDAALSPREENCWVNLVWARSPHGWYADYGLTPSSPLADFQYFLHESSLLCPLPCSSSYTQEARAGGAAVHGEDDSATRCKDLIGPPASLSPAENTCWVNLIWAKYTGIYDRSWWYTPHGLTPQSSYSDFQFFLHNKSGNGVGPTYDCAMPCSSSFQAIFAMTPADSSTAVQTATSTSKAESTRMGPKTTVDAEEAGMLADAEDGGSSMPLWGWLLLVGFLATILGLIFQLIFCLERPSKAIRGQPTSDLSDMASSDSDEEADADAQGLRSLMAGWMPASVLSGTGEPARLAPQVLRMTRVAAPPAGRAEVPLLPLTWQAQLETSLLSNHGSRNSFEERGAPCCSSPTLIVSMLGSLLLMKAVAAESAGAVSRIWAAQPGAHTD
eukprot:CAMPEP_0170602668 /NCGR_PEP_ID=MMETSP0224-20130122/18512_1 /TAXON_ID=285029 /ORGANISM="Togula jolla, Strain CCCM 725" /LENGTH=562 /DNA_ID=CAMNT_0010927519 /DNA_START=39 /DNA_END=1728 /DNA_ORIENTATION=+